jgi:hypothetical protein
MSHPPKAPSKKVPPVIEAFEAESPCHPIAKAVDEFDHALRDIEACIRLLLPAVIEDLKNEVPKPSAKWTEHQKILNQKTSKYGLQLTLIIQMPYRGWSELIKVKYLKDVYRAYSLVCFPPTMLSLGKSSM